MPLSPCSPDGLASRMQHVLTFPSGHGTQCPPPLALQEVKSCSVAVNASCDACGGLSRACGAPPEACQQCSEGQACSTTPDCASPLVCGSVSGTCISEWPPSPFPTRLVTPTHMLLLVLLLCPLCCCHPGPAVTTSEYYVSTAFQLVGITPYSLLLPAVSSAFKSAVATHVSLVVQTDPSQVSIVSVVPTNTSTCYVMVRAGACVATNAVRPRPPSPSCTRAHWA